jgi:hypothetical protein
MKIKELKNQTWISAGFVLDKLAENNISYEYDENGINTENGHIDVYDGMMYKDGIWSIDWETSPECKCYDVEIIFDKVEI